MANKENRWPENAPGKFYVDKDCIACDACVTTAPNNFAMNEDDGHAFLKRQPDSQDEAEACKEALEGCPVEAIGNDNESGSTNS